MCNCGDLYCRTCGPKQGNHYCVYCRSWDADGGCPNPDKCWIEDQRSQSEYEEECRWESDRDFEALEAMGDGYARS